VSLRFVDLETTGLRPDRGGRICEMAVVDRAGVRFDWTSEREPPPDEVVARRLPELIDHLRDGVVVGHNLSFDVRFLTYEAERLGLGGVDLRFADTLGLARRLWPGRDDYRLGRLLTAVGAAPDEALHTAVGDALATRTLFWRLVEAGALTTLGDLRVRRLRWHGG
jgi:DNA polymerase III epsilon subunit-like protein